MTQKIIICGFPHCGTSILKSIIGHIENVEEIKHETNVINTDTDKPFILCKTPLAQITYFDKSYDDYIKIFIIRNPLFVFSSLNKRFSYNIPHRHSMDKYINIIKLFIKYRNNPEKNVYTIRYEDIFDDNYESLRIILHDIGMKYKDSIFNNTQYTNVICPGVNLTDEMPNNVNHAEYRTWQINQPFVSNNDTSKLDLSEIQKQIIMNNTHILEVYPDLRYTFFTSSNL
jgi:hypothetical protein